MDQATIDPQKEMNTVVYHCWFNAKEAAPHCNLRTPTVLSIASLRSVFDGPVHVIDLSEQDNDWAHFPDKLKFTVNRRRGTYAPYARQVPGWRHLSRIPDVHRWALGNRVHDVIYSDTDVFWLKAPAAVSPHFGFDGFNSGFYGYQPEKAEEFITLFERYTLEAIGSVERRAKLRTNRSYDSWYGVWDEMILIEMVKKHPALFEICPPERHVTTRNLGRVSGAEAELFHTNSSSLHNPFPRPGSDPSHCPGAYALAVWEIYARVNKVLDEEDFETLFTSAEIDYFIPRQFSLENIRNELHRGARRGSPWHTDLDCFLSDNTKSRKLRDQLAHCYWMLRHKIWHA
jgi:hypothetical protein